MIRSAEENARKKIRGRAFTLAELIVVIAILAVLATVGFLSLSWYREDAKSAAVATNVRSVYSAIVSEAASTTQSARCFIKHDSNYALTWGAFVAFDGSNAENLVGWPCGAAWTNYSAGNPDYPKLRLDAEKFKTAFLGAPKSLASVRNAIRTAAANTADPDYLLVGASDLTDDSGTKPRIRSFAQVAGIYESKASVTGDFPGEYVGWGSVSGLVKDTAYSESSTGALVDGAIVGAPAKCPATTASGYSFPELESGKSHSASKDEPGGHGQLGMTATCSFWTNAYSSESVSCDADYVPTSENSCVLDTCSWTAFDVANAQWGAVTNGSAGTASWSYSQTPWTCKFSCAEGFTWDAGAGICRASCGSVLSGTYQSLTYSFATGAVLAHGESVTKIGFYGFSSFPTNGELSANFEISCADGAASVTATAWTWTCQTNYEWNSSWISPECTRIGFEFDFVVSSNLNDFHLRNRAVSAWWDEILPLKATVTVNAGVVVGSTSSTVPAFDATGTFPEWSVLFFTNNGSVLGKGGSGGHGGTWNGSPSAGQAGWTALALSIPTNIQNNGIVAWGGGGGGGGGGGSPDCASYCVGGGGGGGGAWSSPWSGGSGVGCAGNGGYNAWVAWTAGNAVNGWGGGRGGYNGGQVAGKWGDAGALWAAGAKGVNASTSCSPTAGASGGAAGKSVTGHSHATWLTSGTVLGPTE